MSNSRNRVGWTPPLDKLLGKLPDKFIAESLGVNVNSVARRRRKLGIASSRNNAPVKSLRRAKFDTPVSRWRMRLGLSQSDAARLLGLSVVGYGKIERGIDGHRLNLIMRLACAAAENGIPPIE